MGFKYDESTKWQVYNEISEALCKEHDMTQLSSWLSDLCSELSQWSLRTSMGTGTPYKKASLVTYIEYMAKVTQLLMAVHCKIKEENPDLYDVIEHGVMNDFYNAYIEE